RTMSDRPPTVDFGAPDKFGAHLFRVEIPASRNESVVIVEDYGYRGLEGGIPREAERVVLERPVWSAIADIARREFNDRLKATKRGWRRALFCALSDGEKPATGRKRHRPVEHDLLHLPLFEEAE